MNLVFIIIPKMIKMIKMIKIMYVSNEIFVFLTFLLLVAMSALNLLRRTLTTSSSSSFFATTAASSLWASSALSVKSVMGCSFGFLSFANFSIFFFYVLNRGSLLQLSPPDPMSPWVILYVPSPAPCSIWGEDGMSD